MASKETILTADGLKKLQEELAVLQHSEFWQTGAQVRKLRPTK